MTHTELNQGIKFIMDLFCTSKPGEIINAEYIKD